MEAFLAQIGPYIVALAVAAITLVIASLNAKKAKIENDKLKERIDTLEEFMASTDTEYYVECPHCGNKICLNKVKIIAKAKETQEVSNGTV